MTSNCSGTTWRSKSVTNVFQVDDDGQSRGSRRRRAPAPPQPTAEADAALKRARSYLTDDVRRQFALGFESSTDGRKSQSPQPANFVKRLVATLERRQRDISGLPNDDPLHSKEFAKYNRNTVPTGKRLPLEREHQFIESFDPDDFFTR